MTTEQAAVAALLATQPDADVLAEALGLTAYVGKTTTSPTGASKHGSRPVLRQPKTQAAEAGESGDAWRHQRQMRAVRGERIA